jgi:hypothetical protein
MPRSGYKPVPDEGAVYVPHVPAQTRIIELFRVILLTALAGVNSVTLHLVLSHQTRTASTIWLGFKGELIVEAVSLGVAVGLNLWALLTRQVSLVWASLYLAYTSHSSTLRRSVSLFTNTILLLSSIFYIYRDVAPLSTYSSIPIDPIYLPKGLAWARVALLLTCGFVIPLIQNRIYTPIDPFNPSPEGHPRQSASILSRLTFTFVDGIIFKAWRQSQIAHDDLPSVPDTDKASYLFGNVIPDLDPIERKRKGLKRRGLLTLILKKYWGMYATMAGMTLIKAVSEFASPVAVNSLLRWVTVPRNPQPPLDICIHLEYR